MTTETSPKRCGTTPIYTCERAGKHRACKHCAWSLLTFRKGTPAYCHAARRKMKMVKYEEVKP